MTRWLTISIFLLFLMTSAANANLISTYDENDEGWWPTGGTNSLVYDSDDGYVYTLDKLGVGIIYVSYFNSPDSWSGDWSSYIGGTLEFDLKIEYSTEGSYYFEGDFDEVIIYHATGGYATWNTSVYPVADSWTSYSVELAASNFSVSEGLTFEDVMSNVGILQIRGEFLTYEDYIALDNVSVTSAIPEPATMFLLGAGLIGLAGARRKFGT